MRRLFTTSPLIWSSRSVPLRLASASAAADLYPWAPVGPFFEHELDTVGLLKDAQLPVAIISGEHDVLIRPARTEALRRKVPNLVFDRTIEGAGHNDIYVRPEFQAAMREALDRLAK